MSLNFYQLKEPPFGNMPDSRFLFFNLAHRQALGSILMGLQQGNCAVSLVGHTGLGKTTLLFHMFKKLEKNVTTVYLFQPPQTPVDLVRAILADLGVLQMEEVPQQMLRLLRDLLADQVRQQKRVVVVIDEAHNMQPSVLETLWLLANPAGQNGHLLQFVLSGQSDMVETEVAPDSNELTLRTPIVARLEPLNQEDTALYIDYRLRAAGYTGEDSLFTPEANALIASYSDGVPRRINSLCFSSMSLAYKSKQRKIQADTVRTVISDLGLDRLRQRVIGPAEDAETAPPELEGHTARVLPMPSPEAEAPIWFQPPATAPPARLKPRPAASAPRPREREVVPFPAAAKTSKTASRLLPGIGLVAAVLLTATATLVNIRRHAPLESPRPPQATASTPVPSPSPVVAPVPRPPGAPAAHAAPAQPRGNERDLRGMDLRAAVRALHGRSLNDLCKANFGQCDSKQLQEMRKVNPKSKTAAHAKAGPKPAAPNPAPESAADRPQTPALASSN